MTLSFIFHLGLPGKCLHTSIENPPSVGALRAPTGGGSILARRHFPGSPRWKMKLRVISLWIERSWAPLCHKISKSKGITGN